VSLPRLLPHLTRFRLRAYYWIDGVLHLDLSSRQRSAVCWSNGPTEGFIHRLKLLKRPAYGRAGVDFLRHRLLASSAEAAA
jgi:hypothetical protein